MHGPASTRSVLLSKYKSVEKPGTNPHLSTDTAQVGDLFSFQVHRHKPRAHRVRSLISR